MHAAVARECLAVRTAVGMLDATTLGKIEVAGPDAAEFLTASIPAISRGLHAGRCRYGVMLGEDGFILDDGVVARLAPDRFHVTTTTGGAACVLHHMEDYLQTEFPDLRVWLTSITEQWAVIAVQGPRAARCWHRWSQDIDLRRSDAAHERAGGSCRWHAGSAVPRQFHRRAAASKSTCRPTRRARLGGVACAGVP